MYFSQRAALLEEGREMKVKDRVKSVKYS